MRLVLPSGCFNYKSPDGSLVWISAILITQEPQISCSSLLRPCRNTRRSRRTGRLTRTRFGLSTSTKTGRSPRPWSTWRRNAAFEQREWPPIQPGSAGISQFHQQETVQEAIRGQKKTFQPRCGQLSDATFDRDNLTEKARICTGSASRSLQRRSTRCSIATRDGLSKGMRHVCSLRTHLRHLKLTSTHSANNLPQISPEFDIKTPPPSSPPPSSPPSSSLPLSLIMDEFFSSFLPDDDVLDINSFMSKIAQWTMDLPHLRVRHALSAICMSPFKLPGPMRGR